MQVNIIGAGIAGSAAAIAMRSIGLDVQVLERHPTEAPSKGSFLTLTSNALAALQYLGVVDAALEAGIVTDRNIIFGADGRYLGGMGLGAPLRPDITAITIRRSALADLLRRAAGDAGAVIFNGRAARYAIERDAADLMLDDEVIASGDLVIAADGVRSGTRTLLDPGAPEPRSLGLLNFGGVTRGTPIAQTLTPRAWSMTFGRHAFFGAIPTPAGDVAWFANVPHSEVTATRPPSGDPAWRARLVELLDADPSPAADLVTAGEIDLAGHDTVDLPPVPTWHDAHCVLIGDAVHAPAPSSGQGAGMALEDAVVLAHHLRDVPTAGLSKALNGYETARRHRVQQIVSQGRRTSGSKTANPRLRPAQETLMSLLLRSNALEFGNRHVTRWRPPDPAPSRTTEATGSPVHWKQPEA